MSPVTRQPDDHGQARPLALSLLSVLSALWLLVCNDRPALYRRRALSASTTSARPLVKIHGDLRATVVHVICADFQWSVLTPFEDNAAAPRYESVSQPSSPARVIKGGDRERSPIPSRGHSEPGHRTYHLPRPVHIRGFRGTLTAGARFRILNWATLTPAGRPVHLPGRAEPMQRKGSGFQPLPFRRRRLQIPRDPYRPLSAARGANSVFTSVVSQPRSAASTGVSLRRTTNTDEAASLRIPLIAAAKSMMIAALGSALKRNRERSSTRPEDSILSRRERSISCAVLGCRRDSRLTP